MNTDVIVIMTTYPDEDSAKEFAHLLLDKKLASCVNILPAMLSIYRWKGEKQAGTEHQLLIKTTQSVEADIRQVLKQHHPYELAELLIVTPSSGGIEYLDWIKENVND